MKEEKKLLLLLLREAGWLPSSLRAAEEKGKAKGKSRRCFPCFDEGVKNVKKNEHNSEKKLEKKEKRKTDGRRSSSSLRPSRSPRCR